MIISKMNIVQIIYIYIYIYLYISFRFSINKSNQFVNKLKVKFLKSAINLLIIENKILSMLKNYKCSIKSIFNKFKFINSKDSNL